ncbi:MAG TPA: hypothetical protein PLB38_03335 [bacterium]|nr:hypothetical protein [bacterium]
METYQPKIEQGKNNCEYIVYNFLDLPERRKFENPDFDLAQKLGVFLVKQGFITNVKVLEGSWAFKYNSGDKTIYINDIPMPIEGYHEYIFCLGQNSKTGEYLFPEPGDETSRYRFLHEVSHAYQVYLRDKETNGNKDYWCEKLINHEINSIFGLLFEYCYRKRKIHGNGIGLSACGNSSVYNNVSEPSQGLTRANEDANELITMYLWNPKYFETFLDYVSVNIPGYGEESLRRDHLIKISNTEKEGLKKVVMEYIREMKENVGS